LKVADLRSELAARGRSTEGLLKAELATELAKAVAEEEQAAKTKKRKANQTVPEESHTSVAECPVSREAARRCGVAWHGVAPVTAGSFVIPCLTPPLPRYAFEVCMASRPIWTMRYTHASTWRCKISGKLASRRQGPHVLDLRAVPGGLSSQIQRTLLLSSSIRPRH